MIIRRALLSVSDKAGIVGLARGLVEGGTEVISSGGTASTLIEAGVPVTKVSEMTQAPEMLGGRVKTLHPRIHGGILADRRKPEHMAELEREAIRPIDLVVCNLYPFEKTVANPGSDEANAVEQIDIGGPAMVRAAAKNFYSVAVVVHPRRYDLVLGEIRSGGGVSDETRRLLALEAFAHTAAYDSAIARYLGRDVEWPQRLILDAEQVLELRYGENPHQSAAFYRSGGSRGGLPAAQQLQGKELSYNNLLDSDSAWRLVTELDHPGAVIVKHSNPCGAAVGASIHDAYAKALDCDRTSAFGGIVALNELCTRAAAEAIVEIFTEVVIAPGFEPDALEALESKRSLRVLQIEGELPEEQSMRTVAGGLLLQSPDPVDRAENAKVVTRAQPTPVQLRDLRFAWVVAKHVRSNAIVFAKDLVAVGVGAGQMSRVESSELAARRAGERAEGAVCASDAFFPFRDGVDTVVAAGASAVIQPGGSVRDEEVIEAADQHGIPMLFTGRRHFRH